MGKPHNQKKPRSGAEEERDRRNIARLYLKGKLQTEIAEELGISQPTVSRDIKALVIEWQKERVYDINEAKARELAKIDNLELEYWEAWERSKEDAEKRIKKAIRLAPIIKGKQKNPADLERQEIQEESRGQYGDARFLAGIQWCIEQRCKILGVEAPKKVSGMGEDGALEVRVIEIVKHYGDEE